MVCLSKLGLEFENHELKVDITIGDEIYKPFVVLGVSFAEWAVAKICQYPILKPLILLMKRLLYIHSLNISYHGNFYCIIYRWIEFVHANIDGFSIL